MADNNEIDRFVADLKTNSDLLQGAVPSAGAFDALVEYANENGYAITSAQARAYLQEKTGADLSNAQLDAIAYGKTSIISNISIANDAVLAVEAVAVALVVAD
ncbi:MAG: hypothetical protein V4574_01995 [Pseudomonadota bacterium]